MTAEIGVLNAIGVALAADSAVTFGSGKIFNSADKLFSLSKHHPVGVMIYGNANFMGVPWETIIKLYREHLGKRNYPTLKEYYEDFFVFLKGDPRFVNPVIERSMIAMKFKGFLNTFLIQINDIIAEKFKGVALEEKHIQQLIFAEADYYARAYDGIEFVEGFNPEFFTNFIPKYNQDILQVIREFVNFNLDHETFLRFLMISFSIAYKNILESGDTGIVFAGFGEEEIFPSLKSFMIEGIFDGVLKYKEDEDVTIDATNEAVIVPFAQQEMVHSFIKGIEPELQKEINQMFNKLANVYPDITATILGSALSPAQQDEIRIAGKNMIDEFNSALEQMINDKYSNPILETVGSLPKEELAAMAEALVNLTSIKRKISNQRETVGGPIDVAVISKGDGFIWIKRKHYFSPDLNYSYLQNYIKG